MSRNRVFLSNIGTRLNPLEKAMDEMVTHMAGIRPLDGTNLAWIYKRKNQKSNDQHIRQQENGRKLTRRQT